MTPSPCGKEYTAETRHQRILINIHNLVTCAELTIPGCPCKRMRVGIGYRRLFVRSSQGTRDRTAPHRPRCSVQDAQHSHEVHSS